MDGTVFVLDKLNFLSIFDSEFCSRSLSVHPNPTIQEITMKKTASAIVLALAFSGSAMAADIVDTAVSAGSFNTLVIAVKTAGLVDTLKGPGPFTVFAPTDEAFAKIPKDQLNALLADKKKLTDVLTYHVLSGKVMAKDVKAGPVKTVEGQSAMISTDGGPRIDNARIIKTDVVASNGVIHVIDTVIMPQQKMSATPYSHSPQKTPVFGSSYRPMGTDSSQTS
jgi:uncharacterized surface protein with fasciclin (FAS1) repeats